MYKICILLAALFAGCCTSAAVLPAPEGRIIGGEVVDIGKYEYLVSIRYKQSAIGAYMHKCAGAIYSEKVIITGAQCIEEIGETDRVMVVVGANTRTAGDGMPYPVHKWIAHPSYSFWTVDYDVGILILEEPIDFKAGARAIAIRNSRPLADKIGTIAGWGYREEFGPSAYNLEQAKVPFVSTANCVKAYGAEEITDRMICAGDLAHGGKDACQGDTGGPLVYGNELVGLVSWGRGCGRVGYPSVYTFVGSVKKWIDDTIAANL